VRDATFALMVREDCDILRKCTSVGYRQVGKGGRGESSAEAVIPGKRGDSREDEAQLLGRGRTERRREL
jgi:hypothetical protein